ncbi:MAG: hypothetical protein EOO09_08265 [Chitinophagaceae bacterium]|nr:MAG: hypothetical protein EOO09_08265 [Chitinophagaceae bacterium]
MDELLSRKNIYIKSDTAQQVMDNTNARQACDCPNVSYAHFIHSEQHLHSVVKPHREYLLPKTRPMINERTAAGTTANYSFLTLSTVDCIDVFIRPVYKQVVVHTLNHFIEQKKLNVYAWCLMTNHLQLIVDTDDGSSLTAIEKEYKHFTTEKILEAIDAEPEVRRSWMLWHFKNFRDQLVGPDKLQIWQAVSDCSAIPSLNEDLMLEHFEHIHQGPVRERIVDSPVEYRYSSARDYTGMPGLVNVVKLPYIEQRLAVSEHTNGTFLVKYVRGS